MKISIGRTVHFVMPNGAHRPAVVVNGPFGEAPNLGVNLQIALDKANDGRALGDDGGTNVYRLETEFGADVSPGGFVANVYTRFEDPTGQTPGTWHWPEREDAAQ